MEKQSISESSYSSLEMYKGMVQCVWSITSQKINC